MTTHRSTVHTILILIVTLALLTACGGKAAKLQAVPTATETPLPPTATQTTAPTATETPVPTDTPTPTATPTPDLTATAGAEATKSAEEAMAKIKPELEKVGIKVGDGKLVWHSEEDIALSASHYNELNYQTLDDAGVQKDFVLHSDIGWNSSSGLAGCGFIYRAEDDIKTGAQYHMLLVRLQSAPGWLVDYFKFGKWQFSLNAGDEPQRVILDKPDSVNKITLVARGQNQFFYLNGEKMRQLESNKLLEGILAFQVYQESGKTDCTFSNSWVYALDKN